VALVTHSVLPNMVAPARFACSIVYIATQAQLRKMAYFDTLCTLISGVSESPDWIYLLDEG
jgi:hypothetical protein